MTELRWLTVDEVTRLHAMQIDKFGGTPGIRDAGLLESAVLRPRQRYHYGELKAIVDLAVAYATALRAAITLSSTATSVWLSTRCSSSCGCTESRSRRRPPKLPERMLALAAGRASEAEVSGWVRSRV